jgi:hypothetical protein
VEEERIVMLLSATNANSASNMSIECLLFTETRDITVPIPANLTQALDRKSQSIPEFRNAQKARMQLAKELSRIAAAQRKAEMNARFWEAMERVFSGAGASDPDVLALLQDPYFNALVNWNNTPEVEQERIQREHPQTVDLTEAIEDARDDIHDLSRWLDSPVRRFLDDVAAPLSALAVIHPMGRAGAMVYGGARGAIALAPRLAPYLGRAAVIIGAGAVAGYDRVRAFFSEMSGGDDGSKSGDKGSATPSSRGPAPTPHSQAPYTKSGGQKLADGFKQNLNRLNELRETVVYAIKERFTGKVMKYGETAAGYFKTPDKAHLLRRAQRQIDQAKRRGDTNRYEQEIIRSFGSKKEARAFETQKIDQARKIDPEACPWNKGRH